MDKRLNFLDKNKLIYLLQFEFTQNYSTCYAVIHFTEPIRQSLDQVLFAVVFLLISKKLLIE